MSTAPSPPQMCIRDRALCDSQGDELLTDSWSTQESDYFVTRTRGAGTYLKTSHLLSPGKTYIIKVVGSYAEGDYALSISSTQDDNWGTFEKATPIQANQWINGRLEASDDMDFFYIDLPNDKRKHTFSVSSDNQIKALFTDSNRIKLSDVEVSAHGSDSSFAVTGKGQRVYIWIESSGSTSSANYSFKVIGANKSFSTLKLTKYKKGSKKIVGRTIKNAKVTVKIKKKKYTTNSNKLGNFSLKLKKKLKARNKIKVTVAKASYSSKTKIFRVK